MARAKSGYIKALERGVVSWLEETADERMFKEFLLEKLELEEKPSMIIDSFMDEYGEDLIQAIKNSLNEQLQDTMIKFAT